VAAHLVIPVSVLTFIGLAEIQRQMRGSLLDVLRNEYVRTARAKGLSEFKVIYVHALRNAINPLITLLGFEFASLLSGAALTETVLAYPGLGRLTLEAVQTKDMNLVMASLMLGSVMLIAGNLLADILLKFTDPRISLE
jgi:peptide/nickel transport system permease protein